MPVPYKISTHISSTVDAKIEKTTSNTYINKTLKNGTFRDQSKNDKKLRY
jgi:hypothetical protein